MKHSLRLARMSRMDLTPNPPDDEAPTEAFAPLSAAERSEITKPPPRAGAPSAEPLPPPSSTWNVPPVIWKTPDPADIEPPAPESPAESEAVGAGLPGSSGEHLLQLAYGSRKRAERFYNDQMCAELNDEMIEFVGRMEMAFIATADAHGETDCSLRAGPPGFIQVLDKGHIAYPEYRGNGVLASLGNISENPHVGIMLIDFVRDRIGLHINGRAMIVDDDAMRTEFAGLPEEAVRGRQPERWVLVEIDEAYIHCRKHIPRMQHADSDQAWGTDDVKRKGGDYFGVKKARKQADAAPAMTPACPSTVNG